MKRVVITGMGTVNPLGNNVADFWKGIVDNKIGFSFVDKFVDFLLIKFFLIKWFIFFTI